MFSSTIIPTIARSTLTRAVNSVLEQSFTEDDFEIIVVNDSGQPLPFADWQQSPRVRLIETQRRERSVARNTGAAIARGRYLHFLDDDDWLLPGALEAFWKLAQTSDAAWLYGGWLVVDEDRNVLAEVHYGASGNILAQIMVPRQWLMLQASLIKSEAFFAVGGFHPLLLATQDSHLCRKIALERNFGETSATVACLLRGSGWNTTTDYRRGGDLYRWQTNMILDEPGVFARIHASAPRGFWRGRIVRIYLSSMLWNFKRRRLLVAASRMFFGIASLVTAAGCWLSKDFWRGVAVKPLNNMGVSESVLFNDHSNDRTP